MKIGIVGLPNAGKSTLFSVLTKREVLIAPHLFSTIKPNVAQVSVPDPRLQLLSEILKPPKTIPAQLQFIDIAGLVKGAHLGQGLGNQFLSYIMTCNVIVHVVRAFEEKSVAHPEGRIDPMADIEIINREFEMKDQELLERHKAKNAKRLAGKAFGSPSPFSHAPTSGVMYEQKFVGQAEFSLLSKKPQVILLNIKGSKPEQIIKNIKAKFPQYSVFAVDLKVEKELENLTKKELKELKVQSCLDQVITLSYNQTSLITFYTIAGLKEVTARILKKGQSVLEAAGQIHTDFKNQFKKAEVLSFEDFNKTLSWHKAKGQGLIKTVGKDYQVQDGDIVEIKI